MNIIPNSFQTHNAIVDQALMHLTGNETKVLLFATRHILGWRDSFQSGCRHISLSVFECGFETASGYICNGVGLSRQAIINATKSLVEFGLLVKVGEPTKKGQAWALGSEMAVDVMEQRTAKNNTRWKKQTQACNEMNVDDTENSTGTLNVTGTLNDTGIGTLNVTGTGTLNDTHKKPYKNQIKTIYPPNGDGGKSETAKTVETLIPKIEKKQINVTELKGRWGIPEQVWNAYSVGGKIDSKTVCQILVAARSMQWNPETEGEKIPAKYFRRKIKVNGRDKNTFNALFDIMQDVLKARGFSSVLIDHPEIIGAFYAWWESEKAGADYPGRADAVDQWFGRFIDDYQKKRKQQISVHGVIKQVQPDQTAPIVAETEEEVYAQMLAEHQQGKLHPAMRKYFNELAEKYGQKEMSS